MNDKKLVKNLIINVLILIFAAYYLQKFFSEFISSHFIITVFNDTQSTINIKFVLREVAEIIMYLALFLFIYIYYNTNISLKDKINLENYNQKGIKQKETLGISNIITFILFTIIFDILLINIFMSILSISIKDLSIYKKSFYYKGIYNLIFNDENIYIFGHIKVSTYIYYPIKIIKFIISYFFVTALGEEFIWRFEFFKSYKNINVKNIIFINSFLFAIMHFISMDISSVVCAFLSSFFILSPIFYIFENLYFNALLHFIYNLNIIMIISMFSEKLFYLYNASFYIKFRYIFLFISISLFLLFLIILIKYYKNKFNLHLIKPQKSS